MSNTTNKITPHDSAYIQKMIFNLRGENVMLDRDLAELYEVPTKRLNEQVKRNLNRFPPEFRFQLDETEKKELVAKCDRFRGLKHSSTRPYAFTEQGVAMLSAVLKSDIAVSISIKIINAFVNMRRFLQSNAGIFHRLENIELKQIESDKKFEKVFRALQNPNRIPKQGIFYEGRVFDAYKFIASLIRKAEKNIILIDNYVDETVLELFTKKKQNVSVTILTGNPGRAFKLDEQKFNQQYPLIRIVQFEKSHDRFLLLDNRELYHFGASLKDLGKKWFAFSKMDKSVLSFLDKVEHFGQ